MAAATATAGRHAEELSPRQNAPASMEDAIQSLGSMKNNLGPLETLDLRADPDAQATITDFLDFTEYLPADMTRSLTLIGKLDQTYIDASTNVHNLTKRWGELPNTPADERPQPVQLRAEISKNLGHVISSRTYAHAEAARMAENATRHYNRAKTILAKLQTLLENYPTAEEQQKSPVLAAKTAQASRANKMTMRVAGRKGRGGRPVPRITVPGEVLPPYDIDFAAYSTGDESSSEEDDDEDDDDDETPPAQSALAQPRIKIVKNPKQPKTPKPPKGSRADGNASGVPRSTQPVPPMSSLKPPPEDAVVGSADAPWLQLTAWELARLRKRMKKNAQWSPSDTMIARELKALGRGPEAYKKAKQLAEEQGKPFDATIPASVAGADGVEHPPMGALSLDAALAAEDKQSNNRGLKLNVAKKLKKENLAKLAAELAEESARKMKEEVNALLFATPSSREKPAEKAGPEPQSSRNPRKYGGRKRKRDSITETEEEKPNSSTGPTPGPAETPLQKRTKTETPVPLPQQAPSLASTSQETQLQPPPAPNPQSTSPIPVPILAQEQVSVAPALTLSNSPPASLATATATVPVKQAAELVVPPQSPKKSTTPILPPVRETRKSSQTVKKEHEQEQQQEQQQQQQQQQQPQKDAQQPLVVATSNKPPSSSPRAGTPIALGSSRPNSRGKTASTEPPQSLASDRPRRTSTARNTPAPEPRQHGKQQRAKRPAPGVISRTNSGGSSAIGRRKAPPKKKVARATSASQSKKQPAEAEGEVEVDDEGNVIDPDEARYCLCNRVSFGTMIQCENVENCKYEWFHLECVDMDILPARTTKWYCPACRKLLNIGEKGEVSARGVRA